MARDHDWGQTFSWTCSNRTRDKGLKLKGDRFTLDIRKTFHEGSRTLGRVAKEVVNAPSLETSKVRLDGALYNLTWWKMALLRGWSRRPLKTPSNPIHSVILTRVTTHSVVVFMPGDGNSYFVSATH